MGQRMDFLKGECMGVSERGIDWTGESMDWHTWAGERTLSDHYHILMNIYMIQLIMLTVDTTSRHNAQQIDVQFQVISQVTQHLQILYMTIM